MERERDRRENEEKREKRERKDVCTHLAEWGFGKEGLVLIDRSDLRERS